MTDGDENPVVVEEAFSEWDSWDKSPVQQQQQQQQQRRTSNPSKQTVEEPEPEPDYFSDLGLAPTIRKQKKVFLMCLSACISMSCAMLFIKF